MSENTPTSSSGDSPIDVDEFMTASYLIPARKSVVELLEADKEDESLRKYKETLLPAEDGPIVVDPSNTNNVIVKRISLVVEGEVKHSMDLPASTDFTFSVKEGCAYKIRFEFNVQREIVSGLKYLHKVTRLGIGGIISRGKYRVRSLISDDDKNRWLEWSWNIDIDKNW
uniref:Rho GDP-dissociation inhibitor 1 n=1 Tax=Meloidogyne hapla TaxID=6305 RepID=A0A1I8B5X6_MELHA